LLDYENPSFYKNNHQTGIYGFEIQSSLTTDFGITSIGGEYKKDLIESSNLGNHQRENYGAFAEQNLKLINDFNFIISAFAYKYAEFGWKLWPGLDMSYKIKSNLRLFGSVGKAFRIPSYTELYYSDPITIGDPNLQYEETVNYEIGANYAEAVYNVNASVFRKEGSNIIDWVRYSSDERWQVMNIAEVNTNGFEVGFSIEPQKIISKIPLYKLGINYTYLQSDKTTAEFQSRYVLDYLKHQLIINLSNPLFFDINQSWFLRYEDRINLGSNFIVDTQLAYKINSFNLFIKATNLFNKPYEDIVGLPLPGRWITAGIKYYLR